MSEEQQTANDEQPPPVPDDPPPVTEPEPEPEPTPPPPTGDTLTWEPQTWYSITYACRTAGCKNENVVRSAPMFYSNDGQSKNIRVVDAADDACKKDCVILTADKLDPQPVEE
ncbi:hypothetical protein AB0933_32420 [Streptomyces venezuelae]|uniref:hypothetical protein n=1 Tax=Streptomyces venezuelae TaxID=54571 RepID=UPI003451F346